jgi:hypothetical protein
MYTKKMKKVFALLTIVTVVSFVACKNKPAHDDKADSMRRADSIEKIRIADSTTAAEKAAADAAAMDTANKDTATGTTTGTTTK